MPTFLSGLPLHPLVVHAVVVLVPAAVLGAIAISVRPAARRRWGPAVTVVAALAAGSIPLATSTGEALERNLPRTPAMAAHTELGDQLLVFVAPLFVAVLVLVVLDHRRRRADAPVRHRADGPGGMLATGVRRPPRIAVGALAAVTVLLAVVSAVQVVRIGDSGARAAWGDVHYAPQPPPDGVPAD